MNPAVILAAPTARTEDAVGQIADPFAGITAITVDIDTPCRTNEADLWFAEQATQIAQAKSLCASCPLKRQCLEGALQRQEPWGVWGGEVLVDGRVVANKRGRGRPRKHPIESIEAMAS